MTIKMKWRNVLPTCLFVTATAAMAGGPSRTAINDPGPMPTNRFIVKLAPSRQGGLGASQHAARVAQLSSSRGMRAQLLRETGQGIQVWMLDRAISPTSMRDLTQSIATDQAVEYAEPDLLLSPAMTP